MNETLAAGSTEQPKSVTVKELDNLVEDIFKQRGKIQEMEAAVAEENKKLAAMKQKAVVYLEELGRDDYKLPGSGTIRVKEQWRFNLPSTDADKKAFFDYLRERGLYDKYATVNSQSYNSFLNAEWEIAKQEGRGMDFQVPGVPEPKFFRDLSVTKG